MARCKRYGGQLQLAEFLGISLVDCTRKITNREFNTWQEWRRQQWNSPGLNEWYLMQLTAEIRRSYVKHPERVKTEGFELQFKFTPRTPETAENNTNPEEGVTAEQINNVMLQMWFSRLGQKVPEELISGG